MSIRSGDFFTWQLAASRFEESSCTYPDEVPGFEFEVMDADPRRIKRLKIRRKRAEARPQELRRRTKKPGSGSAESAQTGAADTAPEQQATLEG